MTLTRAGLTARWYVFAIAASMFAQPGRAEDIRFPDDSRVVNVREFGARGDGVTDDTAAIREAFKQHNGNGDIIYFPNGTYLISDTINWQGRYWNTILQGQSEAGTVIRLADNAPGFGDGNKPRHMLYTGGAPAQRFRNAVRNVTIDSGRGNAGAVALNFCANNQGGVWNVTLRSGENGAEAGAVGLGLHESEVGPLLVRNVTVIGFDIGIRVRHAVNSVTLEHITLRHQRQAGIDNHGNMVFARKVTSENAVPALVNDGDGAVVTLIDSTLTGTGEAARLPAMRNVSAQSVLFARNVAVAGYARAIEAEGQPAVAAARVEEWVSGAPFALWPGEMRTLNLAIEETPEVRWDDPADWKSPIHFGGLPGDGKDDTAAIQQAIDSGATTVYLPRAKVLPPAQRANNPGWDGAYQISDTIRIRGNVRRIIGLEAWLRIAKPLRDEPAKPVFLFENGSQPVVLIERLAFTYGETGENPLFKHVADRDLVISSFSGTNHLIHEGKGRLFADDTVGNEWHIGPGSRLFARQLNQEGKEMKLVNDGGIVWILGLKTEARGPILTTRNGGKTEVIGAHLYKCVESGSDAGLFFVEDAEMTLAGVGEYAWTESWGTRQLLREKRGGETRTLDRHAALPRGGGSMMPLVASFPSATRGAAPAEPRVSVAAVTAASITLAMEADDADGDLAGFRVTRDGATRPTVAATLRERRLTPDTAYRYSVRAYDRFGNESSPTELVARTHADTVAPTAPSGVEPFGVTDEVIGLKWREAKDEIGVVAYEIERTNPDASTQVLARVEKPEYTDKSVAKGVGYGYAIRAVDAAGNRSTPGTLRVQTLAHPPTSVTLEAIRHTAKAGDIHNQGGYMGNIHWGAVLYFEGVELGRQRPFDQVTFRYCIPDDRAGTQIEILLDPAVEKAGTDIKVTGGTSLGTFTIQGTGGWGWENMKSFSMPVKIERPGKHSVALVFKPGDSREGPNNAVCNLHTVTFGMASAGQ